MDLFKRKKKEQVELTVDELFDTLLVDYTTPIKQDKILLFRRGMMEQSAFLEDAWDYVRNTYHASEETLTEVMKLFEQYILGYSHLTPLIESPDITDIRCISYDNIRIKENGVRKQSDIEFRSKEEYENFVRFVATRNKVSLSNLNAIQRFTDIDSNKDFILRFSVSMPLVNTYKEPYLVIRKVPKNFPEMDKLVKKGMLSKELAHDLVERFRSGSTLICGGNSAGKTTLLNALKESLPEDMAVLVEQQADELTTKWHPDMMFLHSLPGTAESQVSYDLQDISILGLTMDVDYFIVGEVKGAEAKYLLNAAYTGQICAASIHAPSADTAIDKMVDYGMEETRYSRNELMKMMACFKTVVFMKKFEVNQVFEVKGWNEDRKEIDYIPIYERGGRNGS